MKYNRLGHSGLKVSELSFGSWVTFSNQLDTTKAKKIMSFCYDNGVNFFDNAEVYASGQSEKIMGECIKSLNWSRDSFVVSSKVFWGGEKPTQRGLSRKHIYDACNAALKRLQLDYLDLFFCHRPDISTPVEETVFTMDSLIRQGKICYWGTSEWSATQIMQACMFAKANSLIPPTMEQPQYNMFERNKIEKDYLPLFREFSLGTTIWSPLASGLLSGKYLNGIPNDSRANLKGYEWLREKILSREGEKKLEKIQKLNVLAKELSCTLSQLSIAWCLKNKNVNTVILGATDLKQIEENVDSLSIIPQLNEQIMARIDSILENSPEKDPIY